MKLKKEKITFTIEPSLRNKLEEVYKYKVLKEVERGNKLPSFSKILEIVLEQGLLSKDWGLEATA